MSTADLQNATAKAQAAGDDVGILCWQALAPVPSPQGATTGVATALEDARIVALAVAGPCSGILGPFRPLGAP